MRGSVSFCATLHMSVWPSEQFGSLRYGAHYDSGRFLKRSQHRRPVDPQLGHMCCTSSRRCDAAEITGNGFLDRAGATRFLYSCRRRVADRDSRPSVQVAAGEGIPGRRMAQGHYRGDTFGASFRRQRGSWSTSGRRSHGGGGNPQAVVTSPTDPKLQGGPITTSRWSESGPKANQTTCLEQHGQRLEGSGPMR